MPEEIDHIEELQKRLYARDPNSVPKQKFGILHPVRQNVSSTWGDTEIPKTTTHRKLTATGFKRFFAFSVIFFILGLGLAAFSILRGGVTLSSKNVELTILGNSFVAGGEELPIQVEIANKNASDLIDVALLLEYPKGATDDTGSEIARLTEELGTISSGKTKSVAFSATLYGEQGLSRIIKATLSYHLAGSTATFEKTQTFSVLISSSPIELTVDGPSVTAADQPFTITVRSLFTGDQPLENPIVRVEYPNGFTFLSATPAPTSGNNVWALGTLEKGTEQTILVRGRVAGIELDEKAFRVYLGTPISDIDNRIAVSYNSALHSLVIERPFIAATIGVGGDTGDIIALPIGSSVRGSVQWQNMSGVALSNPIFTLKLSGPNIDPKSVQALEGYYDELAGTITWTGNSVRGLSSIAPGQSGELPFELSLLNQTAKDDIVATLSVEATLPELENVTKTISGLDEATIRYAARIQFAAQALYSTGLIKNTGPFPPKVNSETSYTVTWTARPTDNPLTNVVATATLPAGVMWAGVIMPQSEQLSYNPDTRQIKWLVGALPKATSIPLSKSVSFQVKARPTPTQVNAELTLLSETMVSATDAVANIVLDTTRPLLTTSLLSDPIYTPGDERVRP